MGDDVAVGHAEGLPEPERDLRLLDQRPTEGGRLGGQAEAEVVVGHDVEQIGRAHV